MNASTSHVINSHVIKTYNKYRLNCMLGEWYVLANIRINVGLEVLP